MAVNKIRMSNRTRITIGAIGGISPIIVSLLVVDVGALYRELGMMDGIGLLVRFLVLIFIGGMVGYMHQSEHEPFKVFQLGIAAPALLTTAINGNSVNPSTVLREYQATSEYSFFSTAHAATRHYKNSGYFKEPKVSNVQLFVRGLIGTKLFSSDDDWYVIIGSHSDINKAKNQVKKVESRGYLAKIYAPVSGSKYYPVVIGANLTLDEATRLQGMAIRSGLPRDTYLWKRK